MHSQITGKMKDSLLVSLPERYRKSKSHAPMLEYEFSSIDSWFLDNVPMLRKPSSPLHYLNPTLDHLASEGFITFEKPKLKFKLTEKGMLEINRLSQGNEAANIVKPENSLITRLFSFLSNNPLAATIIGGLVVLVIGIKFFNE